LLGRRRAVSFTNLGNVIEMVSWWKLCGSGVGRVGRIGGHGLWVEVGGRCRCLIGLCSLNRAPGSSISPLSLEKKKLSIEATMEFVSLGLSPPQIAVKYADKPLVELPGGFTVCVYVSALSATLESSHCGSIG